MVGRRALVSIVSVVCGLNVLQVASRRPNESGVEPPPTAITKTRCRSYTHETEVDYFGNDIASVRHTSAGSCCSYCSNLPGCGAFTWTDFRGGTCWLKSGKGRVVEKAGALAGYATILPVLSTCPALQANVDYTDTVIANATGVKTPESCCPLCAATAGCAAYSWRQDLGGTCSFKSDSGSFVYSLGTSSTSTLSTTCSVLEDNVDYGGADISNAPAAKAEDCCQLCHDASECTAYSWSSYKDGTCWLKSARGAAKTNPGVCSGVVIKSNANSPSTQLDLSFRTATQTTKAAAVHVHIKAHYQRTASPE